jgi:Na+/H+-dicarboxylate symporter
MCGDAHQCEWTADFGTVTDVVSAIPHGISSLDAILSIGFQILPRNVVGTFASGNLLGLIVFSVLFGKALAKQGQKAEVIFDMVETCGDALMSVVMSVVEFTPLGVGSLIAAGIAQMGDGSLEPYAMFIVMALLAQLCHVVVLFGVLTVFAPGCNAKEYYSNLRPAMIMAMATDSSAATLPVTMACARVNRLRQRTIDLVFPLGATVNMDGSTIYYVQAVIFLAAMSGYKMGFAEQVQTGVVGALICCGAAPVPGGFIIFIWMILNLVGVPDKCDIEYLQSSLAVLLAINWFMDRCRTTVNVVGDSVVAGIVEYKIYGGRAFSGQAPAQDALGGEVKGSGELTRGLSSQTSNPTANADVSEL